MENFIKKYTANSRVICFGNNDITSETIDILNDNRICVKCIFDNGSEGKNDDGIPVVNPANYPVSTKNVILIGSKYYYEMKDQLLKLGYKDKQIIQTVSYVDMYIPKVEPKTFFSQLQELIKAKDVYKSVSRGMKSDGLLFISPTKSIGDIYLIIMYTQAYVKKYGIKDFRYIITGGAAQAICKACGVSNYINITMNEMFMLCKFIRFMDISEKRAMIFNEIWAYTSPVINAVGYGKYNNFSVTHKKSVLAMQDNELEFECPLLEYDGDIYKIFRDNNLTEGQTVLLAPYTNYLKPLPFEVWTEIADRLKAKGFSVCTNCASESELPVPGTLPINLSFTQMRAFLETAGYFIGARSGLCDVISGSNAQIHILYVQQQETKFISSADYYSLKQMELTDKENVKEYIWDLHETKEALADRIISGIEVEKK